MRGIGRSDASTEAKEAQLAEAAFSFSSELKTKSLPPEWNTHRALW